MADRRSAPGLVRAARADEKKSRGNTNRRRVARQLWDAVGFETLEERQLLSAIYYVSPTGNDASAGTATNKAWRSIARVDAATLAPGDKVLFQGGSTFAGNLVFDNGGTTALPITVSTFGTGRATINAGTGTGIYIYQVAGFNISNLVVVGSASNNNHGIEAYDNTVSNTVFQHVAIDNVDVSGFGKNGIDIGSSNPTSGYNDVRITNSAVHDNDVRGVYIWGMVVAGSNTNVYIGNTQAYNNGADGLLIGDTNGAVIEKSVAHDNGSQVNGTVGIWTYDSNNITIQYNESYNNRTPGDADGDGFDLDGGVTNSVVQYNYAHGNAGAGFLLGDSPASTPTSGNTIRYNISQNDGQDNYYGSITLYNNSANLNNVTNNYIYNNTVYHSTVGPGIFVNGDLGTSTNVFANNLITTAPNVPVVASTGDTGATFVGNDYWSGGATLIFSYNDTNTYSVGTFRAQGQESLHGQPTGYAVDPHLFSVGGGGTIGNATLLTTLKAYQSQPSSTVIDLGLNLQTAFGLNTGGRDFYGVTTPWSAQGGFDIGASEYAGAPQALPTGWSNQVIGSPANLGLARFDPEGGSWLLTGGGAGIGGSADQFNYVARSLSGDDTMVAKVLSIENTDPSAKVGLMIRSDSTAGAAFVDVMVTASGNVVFEWRTASGAVSRSTQVSVGVNVPVWVGLVRQGNSFVGVYSTTGATFAPVGPAQTVVMGATAQVGLAVTASNNAVSTTASVSVAADNVLLDGNFQAAIVAPGSWQASPAGSPWKFSTPSGTSGAGVATNGSALTAGNPNVPDGNQAGFLVTSGSISQSFTLLAPGNLQLSFYAAQRLGNVANEDIRLLVDGKLVATFDPSGTAYTIYSSSVFQLGTGVHTVQIMGQDRGAGGDVVLIDDVALALV